MKDTSMTKGDWYAVVGVVVVAAFVAFCITKQSNACEAKRGILIRTMGGYECVKAQVIK